jgi:phosphoadenosine phosphosulfate reductase
MLLSDSEKPRELEELCESALAVIDSGFAAGAQVMAPLFSGGHDSLVACHLASQHHRFTRTVHHIDTGIGAQYTRQFVESVCQQQGWDLKVHKSVATYERFVSKLGFPGPGAHQWVYNWLKDRCLGSIVKGRLKTLLITGCRSQESIRRMGHVEPVKIGET